jgi:MATE family, multidrug efflux pump
MDAAQSQNMSTPQVTGEHSVVLDREPWWRHVRDAIRGVHHDYTDGPIGRSLMLLAVPMVLETLMESLFAVADVLFVAKLGAAAVATVGLTEAMLFMIYAIAMGLGIGATALVARRIGEKDPSGAAKTAVQSIVLGVMVAAVIGVTGVTLAPVFLRGLGAQPEVLQIGTSYTRIVLGGNVVVVMLYMINAIFRGAGDAAIAMRVLWFANFMNIVLGPCFIFGLGPFPRLGVTGAAIGTMIGRGCGVIFQFTQLARRDGRILIRREHLGWDFDVMKRVWRLSTTAMFQIIIGTTSWLGLMRILSTFGSSAIAGNTIGLRIIMFALLPSWGLGNAAATMVGQGLGARKPERAERAAWIAAFYNMIFLGVVGLSFVIFAERIVHVFTSEAEVAGYAASCLRTISYGFLFYAYGMVLTNALNGAGDTWTPTWINLGCFWCWELPLAYVLSHYAGLGPYGVFWAVAIAFSTLAFVSAWVFTRGKWKRKVV